MQSRPEHGSGAYDPAPFQALMERVRQGLMVRTDSRLVQPGEVFVAMPGTSVDGSRFIRDAVARGARYVVARTAAGWPEGQGAGLILHPAPRQALGELAAAYFGTAELPFPLIGVTGTNGKTTVSYLIEHLLAANGRTVGVLGTVNYRWPGFVLDAPLTTPDCWQTHELLANMSGAGVEAAVMEVSSHALDQDRVAGVQFPLAVFTNVTQDHLDYHGDMVNYFRAKARLFQEQPPKDKIAILNWDDPYGRILLANHEPAVGYGLHQENPAADKDAPGLAGQLLESSVRGLKLRMTFGDLSWELESPMIGEYNASNLLAAQAVGLAMGMEPRHLQALSSFAGVPGRVERIVNSQDLNVFVDYAHTPDALDNVLRSLRALCYGRLITVFGCGGDRDRTKRPLMGQAVARYSDMAVLTSDNPRHEDPVAIMNDVLPGLTDCKQMISAPDRRQAIALAIEEMRPGDVLLVAGKGHENYQQIGDERRPFSDQQVIREILE